MRSFVTLLVDMVFAKPPTDLLESDCMVVNMGGFTYVDGYLADRPLPGGHYKLITLDSWVGHENDVVRTGKSLFKKIGARLNQLKDPVAAARTWLAIDQCFPGAIDVVVDPNGKAPDKYVGSEELAYDMEPVTDPTVAAGSRVALPSPFTIKQNRNHVKAWTALEPGLYMVIGTGGKGKTPFMKSLPATKYVPVGEPEAGNAGYGSYTFIRSMNNAFLKDTWAAVDSARQMTNEPGASKPGGFSVGMIDVMGLLNTWAQLRECVVFMSINVLIAEGIKQDEVFKHLSDSSAGIIEVLKANEEDKTVNVRVALRQDGRRDFYGEFKTK
jgi:hypothetical protein